MGLVNEEVGSNDHLWFWIHDGNGNLEPERDFERYPEFRQNHRDSFVTILRYDRNDHQASAGPSLHYCLVHGMTFHCLCISCVSIPLLSSNSSIASLHTKQPSYYMRSFSCCSLLIKCTLLSLTYSMASSIICCCCLLHSISSLYSFGLPPSDEGLVLLGKPFVVVQLGSDGFFFGMKHVSCIMCPGSMSTTAPLLSSGL